MGRLSTFGTIAAFCVGVVGSAQATLIDGPVPDKTFGGATSYAYLGTSTSAFTASGGGTMLLALATFGNSFGYSRTDQSGQTPLFSTSDAPGTSRTIAPGYSPFLLYVHTNGTYQASPCYPDTGLDCAATLFSDGSTSGAAGGNDGGQANLAIYYAASSNTYALFFDDGGPYGLSNGYLSAPNDDNDYNDLVVTFTPTTTVPEPMSLALVGTALAGMGAMRRSRR